MAAQNKWATCVGGGVWHNNGGLRNTGQQWRRRNTGQDWWAEEFGARLVGHHCWAEEYGATMMGGEKRGNNGERRNTGHQRRAVDHWVTLDDGGGRIF